MEIRMLVLQELSQTLDLAREVFDQSVAPTYKEEGVQQFREYIRYETMSQRFQARELYFFGAFEESELVGTLAVSRTGHICLFFVKDIWQGKGVGKRLYQNACQLCTQGLGLTRLTINVPSGAVNQCMRFGLRPVDREQEAGGTVFTPMEAYIEAKGGRRTGNNSRTTAIVIAISVGIGAILLALSVAAFFVWGMFRTIEGHHHYDDDYYEYPYEEFFPHELWPEQGYDWEEDSGEPNGLEQIPSYEAENLSYGLEEETYRYFDTEKTTTYIEFHVLYPQLSGDGRDYTKVNQAIEDCAMATVDEIYTNPDESVKEKVMQAEAPALVSDVVYKVCYASEDFISIAFQDTYAKGDANAYGGDLRTLNIGLADGKIYEIKDLVKLDDKFMNIWLEKMRSEAENQEFLKELSVEEMKQALEGGTGEEVYDRNFFLCENGVEIGFDLNYPENDEHDLGYMWVTAPFDWDEIEAYKTDHNFWDILKK